MIREWTVKEAQTDKRVANFMKAFEGATSFVKVNSDYTFERYRIMMERGICRILIAEEGETLQGAIGFIITDDLHDGSKLAVESFWFAHPDYKGVGKALFNAFEEEAVKMGCKKLAMIHLSDSYPESLEKFYLKNGYKLVEKHYIKGI
jgi:GNAT superfamily N-acetyltransferase